MDYDQKETYLKNVDLMTNDFEIKITDFGLSKKLTNMNNKLKH